MDGTFAWCLVVALADDQSVRARKGTSRPILTLRERLGIISSLKMVDYVISYDDASPFMIISTIRPHVFCASHIFSISPNERDQIKVLGIEYMEIERPKESSTSAIIERIVRGQSN